MTSTATAEATTNETGSATPGRSHVGHTLSAASPADLDDDLDVTVDRCPRCGRIEVLRRHGAEMACAVRAGIDDDLVPEHAPGADELRRRQRERGAQVRDCSSPALPAVGHCERETAIHSAKVGHSHSLGERGGAS